MSVVLPTLLTLLAVWFLGIYILKARGLLEKYNLSLWGPALMWRTSRGKKLIKKLSQKRHFWEMTADFSIVFCFIIMAAMIGLLIWEIILSFSIPAEQAPTPQMLLLLPGVNPLIPLSSIPYLIIGIIVAIVIHEFSHGILAMVGKIKIKALGVLYMIIPIGAFVEPDEKQMEKVGKRKRARVFATGPASNMFLAILFALIFSLGFMGSISSAHNGALVTGIIKDSSADIEGIEPWGLITSLNGSVVNNDDDFYEVADSLYPTLTYNMSIYYDKERYSINITGGLVVAVVVEDYPAFDAGMEEGMILSHINGSLIKNEEDFHAVMNMTRAETEVNVRGSQYNRDQKTYIPFNMTISLTDKYEYYDQYFPNRNKEEYRGQGFLGINVHPMGIAVASPEGLVNTLMNPVSNLRGFFIYITLPFQGLSPFPNEMEDIFEITGPFSILPDTAFWILANCAYWIFWLNFALGTFNVLPAIPLDGGYLFKDSMAVLVGKLRKSWRKEKREDIAAKITLGMSLLVLASILSLILIPRLKVLFM